MRRIAEPSSQSAAVAGETGHEGASEVVANRVERAGMSGISGAGSQSLEPVQLLRILEERYPDIADRNWQFARAQSDNATATRKPGRVTSVFGNQITTSSRFSAVTREPAAGEASRARWRAAGGNHAQNFRMVRPTRASRRAVAAAPCSSFNRPAPVNEVMLELLVMLDAFKRTARRITAVLPITATRAGPQGQGARAVSAAGRQPHHQGRGRSRIAARPARAFRASDIGL